MKVDLTDLSPVKKRMLVEVDADEVAGVLEGVVRGYAKEAKIPGFRKGKVPASVIRKRFAKELDEDLRERLVRRYYLEATREKGLRPVGDPVLEEVKHEEGQPFSFQTLFEVVPAIELKGHRGIEVRRPSEKVADDEVDAALEELRAARVQLVAEEGREAEQGDVIVADLTGKPDEGEPFSRERMMLEVGAEGNPPSFNDELEGAAPGAELSFESDYPEDHPAREMAGKKVAFTVKVHEVKRKVLPELDDEFAKDLGDFDDLAALRERVRTDLEHRKKHEADGAVRQALLDKLLLENPVVLPEVLVEEEIRHRLEEIVRRMMQQGIDPEKAELDWKQLREQQETGARKSVHARLMLDKVAEVESIAVEDREVNERLRRDAAAMGEKYETLRQRVQEQGSLQLLKRQLVREKSLDLLTSVANIRVEEIEE
jgi:trigger factor